MITNPEYWRRKLSAFLHDSPDKVISLVDHEDRARSLAQVEGFAPSELARKATDHAASAADRLPWPVSKLGDQVLCRSEFDAADNAFKHPLGGAAIQFDSDFKTALQALEVAHVTRPRLVHEDDPRASFIAVWRFWQNWASSRDQRFAFLPAETRLPDHTIWNHLSVTSAMQGCYGGSQQQAGSSGQADSSVDQPAFLLFSIGPVQDFIAAARNTRDLWSGSYLLSYLIGSTLARITMDFGPDHVIFPNLLQQPIHDLLLRKDLWDKHQTTAEGGLWRAFEYYSDDGKNRLLTPSLPNRFLALLPARMVEHPQWQGPDAQGHTGASCYAASLAKSLRSLLLQIAESVADHLQPLGKDFNRERFLNQSRQLLEIHWQVLEWPDSVEQALAQATQLPGDGGNAPNSALKAMIEMLSSMPKEHLDSRYFTGKSTGTQDQPGQLGQVAAAWSALVADLGWRHDAAKTTRAFEAWSTGGWQAGKDCNKDSLTGKEETCLSVPSDDAAAVAWCEKLECRHALKGGDYLGAPTILKRFWHLAFLCKEHSFERQDFEMPNTRSIAAHRPWDQDLGENGMTGNAPAYFAVLALDGDSIGQWVSGVKCPQLKDQLSKEAVTYFEQNKNQEFVKSRRPLSPSFHLQFSELLGNFAQHCTRRIVEAFDGRLIYVGGDDVLAMLPADTALDCARALRAAFRGEKSLPRLAKGLVQTRGDRTQWKSDRETPLFVVEHEGFIKLTAAASPDGHGSEASLLSDPVTFPVAVPGPATDVSVGVAIAHFKSPLQDVVRAAHTALHHAKSRLGRSAVAVSLFKRSGEIVEWGTQWNTGGLELYGDLCAALEDGVLTNKFPYRLIELVKPYLNRQSGIATTAPVEGFKTSVDEIIAREFASASDRQRGPSWSRERVGPLLEGCASYLRHLPEVDAKVAALIGLCQTVAFTNRTSES